MAKRPMFYINTDAFEKARRGMTLEELGTVFSEICETYLATGKLIRDKHGLHECIRTEPAAEDN